MLDAAQFKNETQLMEILNNYSSEIRYGENLIKISNSMENPEMVIPVLGMQGTGKSTLINALLGENILPNEADETTCVPVEVRYGKQNDAIVYFFNTNKTEKALTREALSEYVDNEINYANKKEVSHIVLYRDLPILENGIVIVDLPGVGSLTKNNQKTTMRYIENLCTAIFMIPTIPTIRRIEEIFIKSVWKSFSSMIFVQNNFGESKMEIDEAVEFNTKVLRSIAKEINVPFEENIIVVNAYSAVFGAINSDSNMLAASKLPDLVNKLNFVAQNRKALEIQKFEERVRIAIDSVKRVISNSIYQAKLSNEELQKVLDKNEDDFKQETKKIEDKVEDIIEFLQSKNEEIRKKAKNLSKENMENLRVSMYQLIDGGVVDGQQLTDAFSDYQAQYSANAANISFDMISDISLEIGNKLEALEQIIDVERTNSIEVTAFNNGQTFKFEKGMQVGIDIIGAIGGFFSYGVIAGAVEGGTLGSFAGPVGTVVGVIAGVGISLIADLIGSKAKKAITEHRGTKTKEQISPYISEFGNKIQSSIIDSYETMHKQINQILEKYIENRKSYYKKMKEENEKKLMSDYQSSIDVDKLNQDMKFITAWEEKYFGKSINK